MINRYFGQYLLHNGLLTAGQFQSAWAATQSCPSKLGVLAMNAGFMSARQVEEVHALQYTQDRRFGEIAVEQNYITTEQLEQLLSAQKTQSVTLGQALVDLEYFSLSQLEQALLQYKQDSSLSAEQIAALENRDFEKAVREFLDFSADGTMSAVCYYEYVALFLRNMIRLLDEREPAVRMTSLPAGEAGEWTACQELTGDSKLFTGITASGDALLALASRYSDEALTEIDELALDSMAEFLNVHNGIFCVNQTELGKNVEMMPQSVEQGVPADRARWAVEIISDVGTFYLLLG